MSSLTKEKNAKSTASLLSTVADNAKAIGTILSKGLDKDGFGKWSPEEDTKLDELFPEMISAAGDLGIKTGDPIQFPNPIGRLIGKSKDSILEFEREKGKAHAEGLKAGMGGMIPPG